MLSKFSKIAIVEKSLFSGKLKDILKVKPNETGFISDDEILEVVVALKDETI